MLNNSTCLGRIRNLNYALQFSRHGVNTDTGRARSVTSIKPGSH
jgi:hypothetical protein